MTTTTLTKTTALELVGGLSSPTKMPCYGYSISALRCQTGMKLRNVKDSVCSKCYALRGNYRFSNVQNALEKRFQSLSNPRWVEAMAWLISNLEYSGFFRWHDSGDIQSVAHLRQIAEVCKLTPNVKHWLPTREYGYVSEYIKTYGALPENLTVRLSTLKMDAPPPKQLAKRLGCVTSGVSKQSFTCPASTQGNQCLTCRACWSKEVENVNYKQH